MSSKKEAERQRRLAEHLADIRQHNAPLDGFNDDYRVPIRLRGGKLSFVTRNGGTALCGSATFTLPAGATPLVCWEPAAAPWLPDGDIVPGHDPEVGPTHPCPHCLQVRGTEGQEAWVFVDGKLVGSSYLHGAAEEEDDEDGE